MILTAIRHPEMPARSAGLEGCSWRRNENRHADFENVNDQVAGSDLGGRRPLKLASLAPQGDGTHPATVLISLVV
jgi:hypothetical protein